MMDAVLLDPAPLADFLGDSVREYETCTPELPPRCWAILLGRSLEDAMRVERICTARSVRETDDAIREEFETTLATCFGAAYTNRRRGFWCDSADLLRISREAEAAGLEVLGSIHLHPDWHRIGPPHERGLRVSQEPTPLDQYLFRNTGWPLNMILYLERRGGVLYRSLGAWAPPPVDAGPEAGCRPLAIRLATGSRE